MTTSLAPPTSSITSSSLTFVNGVIQDPNDTIVLTNGTGSSVYYTGAGIGGSSDTITISNGGSGYASGGFTSSGTISTSTGNVTIGGAGNGFNWSMPEEWDDCFPEWQRIQDMCKQYPGLKIAFEKFKTTYQLVKDHYDTPEDQRPRP